jgi:hypothetical protein
VAADLPYPQPLHAARPVPDAFGMALVLGPADATQAVARVKLGLLPAGLSGVAPTLTACTDAGLGALCRDIPAARGLPLLQSLARGGAGQAVALDYLDGLPIGLEVDVPTDVAVDLVAVAR